MTATTRTLQVTPYLSFKGDCEAAFQFYAQCLDGEVGTLFRYGGSPMANQAPADWQDKVMHGRLTIGALVLMVPTSRLDTRPRRVSRCRFRSKAPRRQSASSKSFGQTVRS